MDTTTAMNHPVVLAWLLDAATVIALALLAACTLYGLVLLLAPGMAWRISAALDRRFSGRRALRPLEVPRATEAAFYRHHRLTGALLVAGVTAFFLLYFLDYPRDTVMAALAADYGRALAGALLDATEAFFLVANALVGLFGAVMFFRPSLLKPLEATANRWLSTRQAVKGMDQPHEPVDRFARRRPRLTGVLVLLGAIYIGISLLVAIY